MLQKADSNLTWTLLLAVDPTSVNLTSFLGSSGNDGAYLHMDFIYSLKATHKQCSHKDLGLD